MGEWKEYKLGDIADITSSKRIYYSDYVKEGIPFYRSKEIIDLFNNRKISTDLFISVKKYEEIESNFGVPQKDDILLTSVGTLGIPFLVKENKFYFKDGNLTWFKYLDKTKILPKYLFIWLKSKVGQDKLNEVAIGSTQQALTIVGLKSVEIVLPPLPEQKAIAGVLSSLDDKIDLLNRQNKTLETMAETLFRQWFVSNGKSNVKSEKFGDLVQFMKGRKPSAALEVMIDGLIPQILIETFDTGKTLYSDPSNMIIAEDKDILMVMDGASSGRVEIGFNGIVGSTIGLFRPLEKFNYPLFLFYFLKINEDFIKDNTTGSAIPHADKSLILDLAVDFALDSVERFEKVTFSFFEKKQNNINQISSLVKLRDTLLPKLMSGEVRVEIIN